MWLHDTVNGLRTERNPSYWHVYPQHLSTNGDWHIHSCMHSLKKKKVTSETLGVGEMEKSKAEGTHVKETICSLNKEDWWFARRKRARSKGRWNTRKGLSYIKSLNVGIVRKENGGSSWITVYRQKVKEHCRGSWNWMPYCGGNDPSHCFSPALIFLSPKN